jgi:hypothetical protein
MDNPRKSDLNWKFLKYLGISHILMWFYGGVLVTLYHLVPPVGTAHTVNAAISLIFFVINMIGIAGIIGKPNRVSEEEGIISWRCFGIAAIFFSSVALFFWLAASMDLSYITIRG